MPAVSWTPPGARRRRITIQQQSATTRTSMGFLSNAWTDVVTTSAKVEGKMVTRFVKVGVDSQPVPYAMYLINIRFQPGTTILRGMRVVDPATSGTGNADAVQHYYLIQDVIDVEERHRELNLFCSQIPAPTAEEQ